MLMSRLRNSRLPSNSTPRIGAAVPRFIEKLIGPLPCATLNVDAHSSAPQPYGRLGIRVVSEEQTSFVMIRQTRRTLTPSCADGDLSGHPPALAAGYVPNLKILIRIGT